jgi:hypothetical protein
MAKTFGKGETVYIDEAGVAHQCNAAFQGYDESGGPIFARFERIPIEQFHKPEKGMSVGRDVTGQPVLILHSPIKPEKDDEQN